MIYSLLSVNNNDIYVTMIITYLLILAIPVTVILILYHIYKKNKKH